MTYTYTCRMCGENLSGDSKDGLVIAAQQHYVNQHGLQHETDIEPTGIEFDEDTIRSDINEKE